MPYLSDAQIRQLIREYWDLPRHPSGRLKFGVLKQLARRWQLEPDTVDKVVDRDANPSHPVGLRRERLPLGGYSAG